MSSKNKANEVRTHLLLKISSEIPYFISLPTKINSISSKKIYESYNNIEIIIENPCVFSSSRRKYTTFIDDNIVKNEFENSPLLEPGFKINKILVSFKKNKNFEKDIEKDEYHKLSNDTNDTSILDKNISSELIESNNENNKINYSIEFLRKTAKTLIYRKRQKKKSKSFYKSVAFKSHGNLSALERNIKKCNNNDSNIKKKSSFKSLNKENKKHRIEKDTIIESSPVIYSSSQYAASIHSGVSFYKNNMIDSTHNLFCKNQISQISYNDNNNCTQRSLIMNIPYEYDGLIDEKKNNDEFIKLPPKQTM